MTLNINRSPSTVAIRAIKPEDNDKVRAVFLAVQLELLKEHGKSPEIRQMGEQFIDHVMNGDLAVPYDYYSQPRKRLWVAESGDGSVAGIVAIDSTDDPDVAELFRMVVSPAHRRKGVGRLLLQAAEEWSKQQGYRAIKLRTTSIHMMAVQLYVSVGYVLKHSEDLGFIKVLDFEKPLSP
jgi:GNAT superfamily N-acetyltransferase